VVRSFFITLVGSLSGVVLFTGATVLFLYAVVYGYEAYKGVGNWDSANNVAWILSLIAAPVAAFFGMIAGIERGVEWSQVRGSPEKSTQDRTNARTTPDVP
jgi:hypothetical protein